MQQLNQNKTYINSFYILLNEIKFAFANNKKSETLIRTKTSLITGQSPEQHPRRCTIFQKEIYLQSSAKHRKIDYIVQGMIITNIIKACLQNSSWNGKISFSGFKGAFKMEYWGLFEEALRQVQGLVKLVFEETKLDKLHLSLLRSFIQWVEPAQISLKFVQNEMDDQDLDEFLLKGLLPVFGHKIQSVIILLIQQLQIVSNPGIFKGHFVTQLKHILARMTQIDHLYDFHFIKSKEYKSLGFIRIPKIALQADVDAQLLKLLRSLQKTYFYKFSLQKCFTEENQKAFQHLIEQTYHEDKLEQIESLDVGECILGQPSIFDKLCKKISTSKGLLSLGFNKQIHMNKADILKSLMGDRYDQLRINHIDIGNNQEILEKGMKILADKLIPVSLKTVNLDGSFNQHLPVLVKLIYIIDAFTDSNEVLKKIMKKGKQIEIQIEQIIPRQMLKKLDLSKVDQYNRHDLVKGLLLAVVFNEFSNIRELAVQNLDIGRVDAYLAALDQYESHITQMKKINHHIYHNFVPKLSTIEMRSQSYRMEAPKLENYFKRLFFTKTTDLLQIHSISLTDCFRTDGREDGLSNYLDSLTNLYETDPSIKFTLKHFKMTKSLSSDGLILSLFFKNVLFCQHFSLESLSLINEEFTVIYILYDQLDEGILFFECGEQFLQSIPLGDYFSLKKLKFEDLTDGQFDAVKLVELLVYSDKVQLQELTLLTFRLVCSEDSMTSLKEKSTGWNKLLSLKKLHLGNFEDSNQNIEGILIEALIISPMSQIDELLLMNLRVQDSLSSLKEKMTINQQNGHKHLHNLKSITLNDIIDYTEDQWELVGDIFIYANDITISSIEIKNIRVSSAMVQGLNKSITKKQEDLAQKNILDLASCFCLQTLILDGCTFQDDLFSLIFSTQQSSLQTLHIINCKELDIAIKLFKNNFEGHAEFNDLVSFQISEFNMDQTIFESEELFEWFFKNIILNKKSQQLKKLSMKSCQLKDSHFVIINKLVKELKSYIYQEKNKSQFRLMQFIFDDNPQISYQQWKDFFDNLLTVQIGFQEKKDIDNGLEDIEIKIQEEEFLSQEKLDKKERKCDEIAQFIVEKRISIPEKILLNPNIYTITPPTQLNRLELNIAFLKETQEVKQRIYTRILKGFVHYPKSQLTELKLTKVDLPLFIISSKDCFQSLSNQQIISPLKQLELITVEKETPELMGSFAKLYISNQMISLEGLIIDTINTGNFYQDLTEAIGQSLASGQICTLKKLQLKSVLSALDVEQTLIFFKTVVFNKNVPLSTLELFNDLSLMSEENFLQSISSHLVDQNYNSPLTSVSITIKDLQQTVDTFTHLIPLLIEGVQIKLNQLTFTVQNTTPLVLFENFSNQNQLVNFTIKDLSLNYVMSFTLSDFKFFYYVRPKLQTLTLQKISCKFESLEEINNFLEQENGAITNMRRFPTLSSLNFEFIDKEGEGTQLLEKFVFGKAFKWDQVTMKGLQPIQFFKEISFTDNCLQGCDLTRHLRYLKINLLLVFNSSAQTPEECLSIIGEQLIYNERSVLEELCLIQCHLKVPGIKALTSGAQAFRDKIELNKDQKRTSLSLKRFAIYYSLYIMDEGAEMLNKDIFFFEYITIEKIELMVTNWNDAMSISHCKHAQAWLQFQEVHDRQRPHFFLKSINWGRNEFVQTQEAWDLLCDMFIFSDKTPLLEILQIHFMSLKDQQIEWICEKADDFFRWKPSNYVHPLRRLDFQLNTAMSPKGWQMVSERFFFSKHINLDELNLISTMLDSQEKLDAAFSGAYKRANQNKTKKLTLHTLLTYNITLKQQFHEVMSIRPDNYQPLQDQAVAIDQCYQTGIIDGIPESFGQACSIIRKTLYQANHITNTNKWANEYQVRFSEYHLEVASGLLKPLSDFFEKNRDYCGHLPIDLTTCDELCTIFIYKQVYGDPYPYQLFFTSDACRYYKQRSCGVRVLNFLKTNQQNAEQVNQFQILEMWELVKSSQTSLDVVYIDYKLDDDLIEAMISKGYNERDVINLVRLFPPSVLRLQDTLTLQALKGIYSIMTDNHQFSYANILFDKDIFLNVGIGYSLREYVYHTNPTGFIGIHLKQAFYHIFNLFVSVVPKYSFTEQIRQLNDFLSTQRRYFVILTLLTIIFYVICIFGPYGFQHYYAKDVSFEEVCFHGISYSGMYCFFAFAFFSFLIEAYLYWGVSQIIPDHIKGFVDVDEALQNEYEDSNNKQVVPTSNNDQVKFDGKQSFGNTLDPKHDEKINLMSTRTNLTNAPQTSGQWKKARLHSQNTIKNVTNKILSNISTFSKSKNGRMLGYLKDLGIGQLAKFHLYTDVSFVMTCYYCRLNNLAVMALTVTALNVYVQVYALVKFILTQCLRSNSKAKLLSTQYINDFYEISSVGRNIALSTILDSVAPYNVTAISNNFISRALVPQLAGKSMSNSVKGYLLKFALEDVPQIMLQLFFVVYRAFHPLSDPSLSQADTITQPTGTLSIAIYLTIINTCISLIVSFINFMSIRPSSLSQADFDLLAQKKTKLFLSTQLSFVEKEMEIFQALTGIVAKTPTNKDDDEELLIN